MCRGHEPHLEASVGAGTVSVEVDGETGSRTVDSGHQILSAEQTQPDSTGGRT